MKLFAADEIRRLLEASGLAMKAMILMGINCGFGNADCGNLPVTALDLDGGWARRVKAAGGPCTVSSDAHSILDFDNVWLGIGSARRGWLEASDVLDTLQELTAGYGDEGLTVNFSQHNTICVALEMRK